MIETLFGRDLLGAPSAFFAALVVGILFGFVLERAGFGSSRRLAGIFYFRDMAVLKVMFTALVTAMLGLAFALGLGLVGSDQLYLMETVLGAQVVGGLVFGVGFVMSGWCPGTAAVGLASGKIDALVFLGGAAGGSILFNETYPAVLSIYEWGATGEVAFAFGLSRPLFGFFLTVVAVVAFHLSERLESRGFGAPAPAGRRLLAAMSVAFVVLAGALFLFPDGDGGGATARDARDVVAGSDAALLQAVEEATDHVEPEALADRMMAGEKDLVIVDVRPAAEFESYHLPGARNVALPDLPSALAEARHRGTIVLYSNGMTHPAQARDVLARLGFENAYHLTDGLQGFYDRCLTPVSLRTEPLSERDAARVRAWRRFFLGGGPPVPAPSIPPEVIAPATFPGYVTTEWLSANLGRPDVVVIDVRDQKDYTGGHVPGALSLNLESVRGVVGGIPSMLMPAGVLATQLGLMGIGREDTVVLATGDKIRDATLIGLALARVGQARWALLHGGMVRWKAEGRELSTALPPARTAADGPREGADDFTMDAEDVRPLLGDGKTIILDARPADYFAGTKSDEARAGHIPGALNRSYEADLAKDGGLLPVSDLRAAYAAIIPSVETPVVVHCRTGHQASQTYFVLRWLLGYRAVRWYDAGWTEWSARPELPIEKSR